jgi:MFS family permease
MPGKWRVIILICICQVLVMALWFSTTAVVPSLQKERTLTPFFVSLLTSSVQVGFVAGTLISALLGLADRLDLRRFFMTAAGIAAAANLLIVTLDPNSIGIPALRFITGMCMAGVYPVGMKMAASWAKGDMGLLVALLVGALTLGSASPHFLNGIGGLNWRLTLLLASTSACIGALLIAFAKVGPNFAKAPKFRPELAFKAWTTRSLRFANLAYFGHMWELYAMWTWFAAFFADVLRRSGTANAQQYAAFGAFAAIGAGAIGCAAAGRWADRWGRTRVAALAMVISGACSLVIGFRGLSAFAVLFIGIVWGISVVADSAQFSTMVTETGDQSYVGTALTMQLAIGFTLTVITIWLVPVLRDAFGWHTALATLALGPILGVAAMLRLKNSPEAAQLAGGRG